MKPTTPLIKFMTAICGLIIGLMPFHAFLTVSLSTLVGHYTALRLWKESLLAILMVCSILVIVGKRSRLVESKSGPISLILAGNPVCVALKCYSVVCFFAGLIGYAAGTVTFKALVYGLIVDLRFVVFFAVVWLVASRTNWLYANWKKLVLVPAAIVVLFGVLQFTVLPHDVLRYVGYGPTTIDAVQTIDQKDAYVRVQSTLRGANPLGAYMIVVLSVIGGLLVFRDRRRAGLTERSVGRRLGWLIFFGLGCVVLAATFSRAAWIGTLAALGWLIFWAIRTARLRRGLLIAGCAAIVAFAAVGYGLRNNNTFQNTFFHTDETSRSSQSSNFGHVNAVKDGLEQVARQPQGRGVGTAGPASAYNDGRVRIAENYYIQIAQETGIIGLMMFLVLIGLLGRELWLRRADTLSSVLLASLVGISLVGLLSHVWADDTLAYIWWGLAGLAMAQPIGQNHETIKAWFARHAFVKQLGQYFFGGGLYFISGLVIFSVCYSGFGLPWWLSKIAGDVVGFSLNYLVQRYVAFAHKDLKRHEGANRAKYIVFSVCNIALDYAIVGGLKSIGITPYIGIFVSAGFFTVWNYLGYKYWVFRRPKDSSV